MRGTEYSKTERRAKRLIVVREDYSRFFLIAVLLVINTLGESEMVRAADSKFHSAVGCC